MSHREAPQVKEDAVHIHEDEVCLICNFLLIGTHELSQILLSRESLAHNRGAVQARDRRGGII